MISKSRKYGSGPQSGPSCSKLNRISALGINQPPNLICKIKAFKPQLYRIYCTFHQTFSMVALLFLVVPT